MTYGQLLDEAHRQGLTVDSGRFIYFWRGMKIVSPPFKSQVKAAEWLLAQRVKA